MKSSASLSPPKKMLQLTPLRCVPTFKSLALVLSDICKCPISSQTIKYRYLVQVQVEPKVFSPKMSHLNPLKCVLSFKSLAQVLVQPVNPFIQTRPDSSVSQSIQPVSSASKASQANEIPASQSSQTRQSSSVNQASPASTDRQTSKFNQSSLSI